MTLKGGQTNWNSAVAGAEKGQQGRWGTGAGSHRGSRTGAPKGQRGPERLDFWAWNWCRKSPGAGCRLWGSQVGCKREREAGEKPREWGWGAGMAGKSC